MLSRFYKFIYLTLIVIAPITKALAQNISGTINIYTNVTNITGADVTVGSAAGFAVCDRVMIIQMKGATINTVNNATFGQITSYGDAGNYEFANISSIAGNVITLTNPLGLTYTISGSVQLIRVPVYTNPTITATLTCTPWNGTTGGVLVFESSGPVTMNANIDVSGRGFLGPANTSGGFGCNNTNYATGTHGKKGEGIATVAAASNSHRAPLANGGGGASPGNAGAAGGGNYGAGGRGGNEYSGCGATTVWGMGGYALTTVPTKAFLGGAGGGGFRDNGQPCAGGANGGGIVMINAPSISGNGFSILANGANVTVLTRDEGAGAGGAGGSVYLRVPAFTTPTNVNVSGGNGGNIQNTIFTGAAHGPGGGGGGGYAWVTSAAMPANLAVTSTGGNAGLIQHAGAWFNTTFGAANGSPGATLYNLPTIPLVSNTQYPPINLGPDTIICGTGAITLQPDTIYASYLWSTAEVTSSINVSTSGTYWMESDIGCGVIDRDSIVVTYSNPSVNLGPDQIICMGDSVQFDAGPGFANYNWNTTATSQSIYANSIGSYMVTVTDAYGCTATDVADITAINPLPVVNLGPDVTQCGGMVTLDAGGGFTTYTWQGLPGNQTYDALATGTYAVQVTDGNGCMNSDTINVTINPIPMPNLGPDVSFCADQSVTFDPGVFTNYLWNTTEVTQTITVNTVGTYIVGVTNAFGCVNSDTVEVLNVYPLPLPNLGPDQSVCDGEVVILNPGGNFAGYLWQDGSLGSTYNVTNSGSYYVTVTDANNCSNSDTANVTVFPLPTFTLGPDQAICPEHDYVLAPTNGPSVSVTYMWSTGSTGNSITYNDKGIYALEVTDLNGCTFSDTVVVTIACPPTLYVPNAFTPNLDEINPLFKAYGTNIKEFKMEIFDRWGELIFTIHDLSEGWNGMMGGNDAPIGGYVYKITYKSYIVNDEEYLIGGFSLLR